MVVVSFDASITEKDILVRGQFGEGNEPAYQISQQDLFLLLEHCLIKGILTGYEIAEKTVKVEMPDGREIEKPKIEWGGDTWQYSKGSGSDIR